MAYLIQNCDCESCVGTQGVGGGEKGWICGGTICNCKCHDYNAGNIWEQIYYNAGIGGDYQYLIWSKQQRGCLFRSEYWEYYKAQYKLHEIVPEFYFEDDIKILNESEYQEFIKPSNILTLGEVLEIMQKNSRNSTDEEKTVADEFITKQFDDNTWKNPGWDELFMRHAYLIATKSKDKHTKIGAVLVKDKSVISEGYNGFPRNVNDNIEERNNRPLKYEYIVHSEMNCLCNCSKKGISSDGSTLYCFALPCSNCTKSLINAGIKELVYHKQWDDIGINKNNDKWKESVKHSEIMLKESSIIVRVFDKKLDVKTMIDGKVYIV